MSTYYRAENDEPAAEPSLVGIALVMPAAEPSLVGIALVIDDAEKGPQLVFRYPVARHDPGAGGAGGGPGSLLSSVPSLTSAAMAGVVVVVVVVVVPAAAPMVATALWPATLTLM